VQTGWLNILYSGFSKRRNREILEMTPEPGSNFIHCGEQRFGVKPTHLCPVRHQISPSNIGLEPEQGVSKTRDFFSGFYVIIKIWLKKDYALLMLRHY